MLAYPFPVVLHSTFQQKIDIPVYVGHEPLRRLGCHMNLSLIPDSNDASPGIKPLCSKIDVNKNSYHIETNQLTCIADQ